MADKNVSSKHSTMADKHVSSARLKEEKERKLKQIFAIPGHVAQTEQLQKTLCKLEERLTELTTKVDSNYNVIDVRVTELEKEPEARKREVQDLNQNIKDEAIVLANNLAKVDGALKELAASSQKQLTETAKKLQSALVDSEKQLGDRLNQSAQDIDACLKNLEKQMNSVNDLTKKDLTAKIESRITESSEKIQGAAEANLKAQKEECNKSFSDLQEMLKERTRETTEKIQSVGDLVRKNRKAHEEEFSKLNNSLDELRETLTEEINRREEEETAIVQSLHSFVCGGADDGGNAGGSNEKTIIQPEPSSPSSVGNEKLAVELNPDTTRDLMKTLDKSGKGKIHRKDLLAVFNSSGNGGWTESRLDKLLKATNLENNGEIRVEDFLQWIFNDDGK